MARGAAGGVPPSPLATRAAMKQGFIGVAYGAGGCGGCPPVSPRHTRGYETRFHRRNDIYLPAPPTGATSARFC
jgi:hypothetical protein